MKIKVCGMRDAQNIANLIKLPIHFIGFIFYKPSKRYVGEDFVMPEIPPTIKKVGVFVNESTSFVSNIVKKYNLQFVQLHGNESPIVCREIQRIGVNVIKAFSVDEYFDFNQTEEYAECCDYFLFDTKTSGYGGSGEKFDWNILDSYTQNKPFFLSGGIDANDVETIKHIRHQALFSLDINSKFEISPALKNIPIITSFVENIL